MKRGEMFLPDGTGGYVCFSNKPVNDSHYSGWLQYSNGTLHKTIENIWLDKEVGEVRNFANKTHRESDGSTEKFSCYDDVLFYEINEYDGWVNIDLDFRAIHDFDDTDRHYEIYRKDDFLIIKYKRREYEKYVAIRGAGEYNHTDEWHFRNYEYDEKRNSKSVFYIYGTLKLRVFRNAKLTFARANTEEEAIKKSKDFKMPETKELDPAETALASLEGLKRKDGIFAGYPWFFQDWSRDELISLKPYIMIGQTDFCRKVLMKNLERLENGKLPNKGESSDLASADAAGWLFLRLHELGTDVFSRSELEKIKEKIDETIDNIRSNYVKDGLVHNQPLETWMDTRAGDDVRAGARIEIQGLFLRTLEYAQELAEELGTRDNYNHMKEVFANKVREKMYSAGKLADGYEEEADWTQRPNVFLAYYIYPKLLSNEEWNSTFDNALEKLWLDWGGLASIERDHDLYKEEYTGQTNESYHRGDSWYYVNNIAAISLWEVNSDKYGATVDKIKKASINEMKNSGFIGHCAEVSSAKELRSEGARCQAWSAATLYELIR